MTAYVLQDAEVKLTGRTAVRTVAGRTNELVEVTPVDPDNGTWKKWVMRGALFEIKEADDHPTA